MIEPGDAALAIIAVLSSLTSIYMTNLAVPKGTYPLSINNSPSESGDKPSWCVREYSIFQNYIGGISLKARRIFILWEDAWVLKGDSQ